MDLEKALIDNRNPLACADSFSILLAKQIVLEAGSVLGMKRATHKKGKYESLDVTKAKAEISTITKARDLIRAL